MCRGHSCNFMPRIAEFPLFPPSFADGRPEAALLPASPDPPGAEQPADEAVGSAGGPGHGAALNLLPPAEDGAEPAAEAPTLPTQSHVPPAPAAAPGADAKQTVKKKLPAPKQANAARKHLKPKPTLPGPPKAVSVPGSRLPVSSQEPAEAAAGGDAPRLSPPKLPWGGRDPTSRPVLQISPSTLPPAAARPFPSGPGDAGTAPTAAPTGAAVGRTDSAESEGNGSTLEESQETTTSTIITTTVITTEPTPGKLARGSCAGGSGGFQQRRGAALLTGVLGPPGTFCASGAWVSPKAALQKCPSTSGEKGCFLSSGFPLKKRWGGCMLLAGPAWPPGQCLTCVPPPSPLQRELLRPRGLHRLHRLPPTAPAQLPGVHLQRHRLHGLRRGAAGEKCVGGRGGEATTARPPCTRAAKAQQAVGRSRHSHPGLLRLLKVPVLEKKIDSFLRLCNK